MIFKKRSREWSVGRKTEGEENDEVEEQMGVLALPTENPNQRKITPPTSLSAESSHFKLWTEKESTNLEFLLHPDQNVFVGQLILLDLIFFHQL